VFYTLRPCNSCRLRATSIFIVSKSDGKWKWSNVTPRRGIDMTTRSAAIGSLLVSYTLRSTDSCRLRAISIFYVSTSDRKLKWSNVAPRSGIHATIRYAAIGFRLVLLYIAVVYLLSFPSHTDFNCFNIRQEAETALCGATKRNRHDQSIGRYRFPVSVLYIAVD
jgi:hypothetical protein